MSFPPHLAHRYLLILLITLATACQPSAGSDLAQAINQAVAKSGIPRAQLGISVRDTRTGKELADLAGDTPRIPASNMKLLTTAAMLSERGDSHVFRTKLLLDGNRLIIVGDGDPALADPDLLKTMRDNDGDPLNVETLLDLWTSAITSSGVRQIDELIVDDRIFDQETMHPHWPDNQVERHYCAQVSGLNFHRNVIWLRPSPHGGIVKMNEMPRAPFLNIKNELKPGGGRTDENLIDPHRDRHGEQIKVLGNIKEPQVKPVEVTIHDPSMFTARLLADRLERRGIPVASIRRPSKQEVFQGRSLEFDVITPLETVARECNHESKNLYAESLLKYLGHARTGKPGSWANGGEALKAIVRERTGTKAEGLVVADGSGMSRFNRIPPSLMTLWLSSFANDSISGPAFDATLPTPGKGTLRTRFARRNLHGCEVMAKTGYINGVSALSGYVVGPDGNRYAFSVIGNDLSKIRPCKTLQESVVEAIAARLGKSATRTSKVGNN
ncbi:MAG: D-alanyl-D-alanine carboxypeptidase/D-alanyl-D-alanine-endopeptidase [Phycisphaerales bacterium]|nr:D-alanyl-D-alanine carboxypeptidase/D-alanyl-D-alanine-endopeptidase [Phycisphaerales bacterium]